MKQVSKASESSSKFVEDSQFLNTMKVNTIAHSNNIPQYGLFPFIADGDIDVLRRELTYRGPRDVFLRDEEFRGPLHFAIALRNVHTPQLITALFNCFFDLSASKFTEDMSRLAYEKETCVESVLMQTMAKPQSRTGRKTKEELHLEEMEAKQAAMAPINVWFDDECRRNYIMALIRNEWFWAQMMLMEDLDGKTPLHYAIATKCSKQTLNALLNATKQARSQLHTAYPKCRKYDDHGCVFENNTIYDTLSGYAIVSPTIVSRSKLFDKVDNDVDVETDRDDDSDIDDTIRFSEFEIDKSKSSSMLSPTAEPKRTATSTGRSIDKRSKRNRGVQFDFDIIIPWLLKNVCSRCAEKGAKFELSPVEVLIDLFESYNREVYALNNKGCRSGRGESPEQYDTMTLMRCEFTALLDKLGIRVVDEVVNELFRRYMSEKSEIDVRWALVRKYHKRVWQIEEHKRMAREKKILWEVRASSRNGHYEDDMDSGAKGGGDDCKGYAGGSMRGGSKDDSDEGSIVFSDDDEMGDAYSDDDYVADSKGLGTHRGRSEGEKGYSGEHHRIQTRSPIGVKRKAPQILTQEDKLFGLNVRKLIHDIRSGSVFLENTKAVSCTPDSSGETPTQGNLGVNAVEPEAASREESQDVGYAILSAVSATFHKDAAARSKPGSTPSSPRNPRSKLHSKTTLDNTNSGIRFCSFPKCICKSLLDKLQYQVMNAQDCYDRTALMIASALGYKEHVELLLACRYNTGSTAGSVVNLSAITREGHTAVSLSSTQSISAVLQQRLVGWLNENKSPVLPPYGTSSLEGTTTSQLSARIRGGDDSDKTRALMQLIPQLEQLRSSNWQYARFPLTWAVLNGLPEAVEHLLAEGASQSTRVLGPTASGASGWSTSTHRASKSMKNSAGVARVCLVNEVDAMGRTAMHECMTLVGPTSPSDAHAAIALTIAEQLYKKGADLNAKTISGKTPLHDIFCNSGNGATKQTRSELCLDGERVMQHRRILLRAMLQWGADPCIADSHSCMAPIHYSARNDMFENCMLEFLRFGSDINRVDEKEKLVSPIYLTTKMGHNCLHIACSQGCPKLVKLLCRWDVEAEIVHRIYYRASKCHGRNSEKISYNPGHFLDDMPRLSSGIPVNTSASQSLLSMRDVNNKLPKHLLNNKSVTVAHLDTLWLACYLGNPSRVKQILSQYKVHGQHTSKSKPEFWMVDSIDCKTRSLKWAPVHCVIIGWAVSAAYNDNSAVAAKLLGINPASIKIVNKQGATLSSNSGNGKHSEVLQLLLKNYAYLDAVDKNGRTPLMIAAGANLVPAIKLLLDINGNGGVASTDSMGHNQQMDSMNITDVEGNNCLHFAYATGAASSIVLIESLFRDGRSSDTDRVNMAGDTPTDNAGKVSYMIPVVPHKFVYDNGKWKSGKSDKLAAPANLDSEVVSPTSDPTTNADKIIDPPTHTREKQVNSTINFDEL